MKNRTYLSFSLILTQFIAGCANKNLQSQNEVLDFSFIASCDYPYGKWQIDQFKNQYLPKIEQEQAQFIIHV